MTITALGVILVFERIDYQKEMHDLLKDTKGEIFRGQLQKNLSQFDHQVNLSFIQIP